VYSKKENYLLLGNTTPFCAPRIIEFSDTNPPNQKGGISHLENQGAKKRVKKRGPGTPTKRVKKSPPRFPFKTP